MSDAKHFLQETLELLKELEIYSSYSQDLALRSRRLYAAYQKGKYGYLEYQKRLNKLLQNKTQQEWAEYYKAYEYSLLKRIEQLLNNTFYLIHKDESYNQLKAEGTKPAKEKAKSFMDKIADQLKKLNPFGHKKVFDLETELEKLNEKQTIEKAIPTQTKTELDTRIEQLKKRITHRHPQGQGIIGAVQKPKLNLQRLMPKIILPKITLPSKLKFLNILKFPIILLNIMLSAAKSAAEAINAMLKKKPAAKEPEKESIISRIKSMIMPKKRTIFAEEIVEMEKLQKDESKQKAESEVAVIGWASGANFIKEALSKEILSRFAKNKEQVIGETTIPEHIKKLRELREKLYVEERMTGFETTLLAQEAKRVKKIMEAQKIEEHKGLSIGVIANLTVKKISLFLVNKFPEFFGFLYNALRAANIRMLSNTYVNIMILSTIVMSVMATSILFILFFILDYPIYQMVLRSIIFGILASVLCATFFYAYPFIKIKERRRSTTTNLPFAINHMASVATSGVPPQTMFDLISASLEYGEVAVEIKKIVDYTTILGYDLLTAMRAVASSTPSLAFKEFLEGMISTIETGGDLVNYLKQKADDATLTYQLERERYNQSISTFSDIYTGLLIAAPLFFVAALALVNMLGGKIGGLGVDIVMALGAYVAIPLMNIAFLIFLQISQPEV